jgi:hypothetical protein
MLALAGCASFEGRCGSLHADLESASSDHLKCLALHGDKMAAFELGARLEGGRGVPQDPGKAMKFYAMAAKADSGRTMVYVPPASGARYGSLLQVRTGAPRAGLPSASLALARLRLSIAETNGDRRRACRAARSVRGFAKEKAMLLSTPTGSLILGQYC